MRYLFLSLAAVAIGLSCGQKTTSNTTSNNNQDTISQNQNDSVPENNVSQVTKTYSGSFFDISYPDDFTPTPDSPMEEFEGKEFVRTDEATFTSPDGSVEFFVFSPQWSGDPENYLNVMDGEELVDESTEESGEDLDKKIVYRATIKAKDGSYMRSFVSIKSQVDTGSDLHHVFGIKYKDQASYDKYKETYISFKESLIQYAD